MKDNDKFRKKIKDIIHMISANSTFTLLVSKRYILLFLIIFVFGLFLRLRGLNSREIHFDESWVVYSIEQPTLKLMLENIRSTPFFFNLILFFSTKLLPEKEWAYRLIPFIFGVLNMPLIFFLSKKITKSIGVAFFSLLLLVFNEMHIYYSKDLKQYSCDMFFLMLIIFVGEFLLHSKRSFNILLGLLFTIFLIISFLFSYISIFPIIVIFPLLIFKYYKKKDKRAILKVALSYTIFFIALSFFYITIIKQQSEGEGLVQYWQRRGAFPDLSTIKDFLFWFRRNLSSLVIDYPFVEGSRFILILLALPLIRKTRLQKVRAYYYYLGIIICIFVVSFFHKYPFIGNRVTLFSTSILLIIVSMGIYTLYSIVKGRLSIGITSIVLTILFFPYVNQGYEMATIKHVNAWDEGKRYIERQYSQDTIIINYNLTRTLWWYYFHNFGEGDRIYSFSERTDKEIGDTFFGKSEKKLNTYINNTEKTLLIVMREPFSDYKQKLFHKQRKKLLNKLEEDDRLSSKFEKSKTYIYEVSSVEK